VRPQDLLRYMYGRLLESLATEKMTKKTYLELLDFTTGLYEQALPLLEPGRDDFSILSGCILLIVGLEKFVKYVLYTRNPLMILMKKIEFEDLRRLEEQEKFHNEKTISFEVALERLVILFPDLQKEQNDITYLIKQRNFLMHNFGNIDIGRLEKHIQTKIGNISEAICLKCLNTHPKNVFKTEVWNKIVKNRDAYKRDDILNLEQKIKFFKRLYSQGEKLPCREVEIQKELTTTTFSCPICEKGAEVALDWDVDDVDVDHREKNIILDVPPYLSLVRCSGCGFTMQDPEEIDTLMGDKYYEILSLLLDEKE